MDNLTIVCLTSDKGNWLIPGFYHLWCKYGKEPLLVAGYTPPPGYTGDFYKIGEGNDYPVKRWSDGLIKLLWELTTDYVILLLEDYWLVRQVNWRVVQDAVEYMERNKVIARCDLTTDRLRDNYDNIDDAHLGVTDFYRSRPDIPYNFSYQASLWRRKFLFPIIASGETPWQSELHGNIRLTQAGFGVAGTRQCPMRYVIVVNKGVFSPAGLWMVPPVSLNIDDFDELRRLGYEV